jgi:hypothetical protein
VLDITPMIQIHVELMEFVLDQTHVSVVLNGLYLIVGNLYVSTKHLLTMRVTLGGEEVFV